MSSKGNTTSKYAISSEKAWKVSKCWKNTSLIWQTVDHFLSIGSFAASVYTIYLVSEHDDIASAVIVWSSVAAILTLMSFACNPAKYKVNYRIAFQILNAALVENTDESGEFKDQQNARKAVVQAIIRGERYIGKTFDTDSMDYDENIDGVMEDSENRSS